MTELINILTSVSKDLIKSQNYSILAQDGSTMVNFRNIDAIMVEPKADVFDVVAYVGITTYILGTFKKENTAKLVLNSIQKGQKEGWGVYKVKDEIKYMEEK